MDSWKRRFLEGLSILCAAVLMLCIVCGYLGLKRVDNGEYVRELSEGWYRLDESGARVPVNVPGRAELEGGGELVLYCDGLNADDVGKTLYLRGAVHRPKVSLGERTLYDYADAEFPRNEQMRAKLNCSMPLADFDGSETLQLTLENPGDGVFKLGRVYVGDADAVFQMRLGTDAFTILLIFTMVLISVIALIISLNLRALRLPDRRYGNVALFLLLCALWCALDSSLVQSLSGESPLVCFLSFNAFMTFPIPMVHFMRNSGELKRHRALHVFLAAFYLNWIGQNLLNLLGVFDMIQMLWMTHLLLFGGAILCACLLGREYRRTRSRQLKNTMWGFVLLAIALYWALGIPYYGSIFECGILLFIICLMLSTISTTVDNLRFRLEAKVYQRLARLDALTGFENRNCFEEYVSTLEQEAQNHANVGLVFLHLVNLLDVNADGGRGAGDELVIAAADCLRRTFEPNGSCYRIGGNEFAVVLLDPKESMETWRARLNDCILAHSRDMRYRLRIACGYSLLRDAQGRVKSFSRVKHEADFYMQQDMLRLCADSEEAEINGQL